MFPALQLNTNYYKLKLENEKDVDKKDEVIAHRGNDKMLT